MTEIIDRAADSPDSPAAAGYTAAYDAVLLAGFGGPESPDEVMPFLRTVTRGRGIPDERLVEVSHHYLALGGVSPINDQNRALQAALREELLARGIDLPVLWGNRNSAPWLTDTVRQAAADGRTRLLGLATSAYSSYSSCRQYREDFGAALLDGELVGTVRIDKVRPYYDTEGFLAPFADGTVAALTEAIGAGLELDQVQVVFTTHSIPATMADASGSAALGDRTPGGAYVAQHLAACRWVIDRAGAELGADIGWQLAFQSRSGPPQMPWLEPDIGDVIAGLPAVGRSGVVVVPIGFVSDHVEVVWDLDNEAQDAARDAGVMFWRVATPGTDPRFVTALADLIVERIGLALPHEPATDRPTRPDFCAVGCCVNLRGVKPTTAAQDSAQDWAGSTVDPAALARSGIVGATDR